MEGKMPSYQGKLLALHAGQWLLNVVICMVRSEVLKAVDAWVCACDKAKIGGGCWSSDSIQVTHKQWANSSITEEKEDVRQRGRPLLYMLGSPCIRVGLSHWPTTRMQFFSGQICDHDWRRAICIEFSKGCCLCEIEQTVNYEQIERYFSYCLCSICPFRLFTTCRHFRSLHAVLIVQLLCWILSLKKLSE